MLPTLGHFLITFNLALSVFTLLSSLLGLYKQNQNLVNAAKKTLAVTSAQSIAAFIILAVLFIQKDYSVRFIAEHASNDLPVFYLLSAVWSGMNGSLLLWNLILSILTLFVLFQYKRKPTPLHPYFLAVIAFIHLFLLFLLSVWSNPFERIMPSFTNGDGLNPLLQNIGMVIHPPMLYIGYVTISIPFAFAMSSLFQKDFSSTWIQQSRRWILASWFMLTLGMFFGATWAYVELGWGGYWAWDPVENASLMPWLAYTALLHSLLIQEKRKSFILWNYILIALSFGLSILGTFITRSGILNSVHAFATSPIGPFFLVFLAFLLIFTQIVLIIQFQGFQSKHTPSGLLSRTNLFLFTNLVFMCLLFSVTYATLFPLLAEGLLHKKMSVQAPFFNAVMAPLAALGLFLLGIAYFLQWRNTKFTSIRTRLVVTFVIAIVLTFAASFISHKLNFILLCFAVCFTLLSLLPQAKPLLFFASTEQTKKTLFSNFIRNKRKQGALLIHFAVILMLVGFIGNFFNSDKSFTLAPDESVLFHNYKLTLKDIVKEPHDNSMQLVGRLLVEKQNQSSFPLEVAKVFFPQHPEPVTKIGLKHTLQGDLYLTLASFNEDNSATFIVSFHPLIAFLWASIPFYTLGFLLCFIYKPVFNKPQLTNKVDNEI